MRIHTILEPLVADLPLSEAQRRRLSRIIARQEVALAEARKAAANEIVSPDRLRALSDLVVAGAHELFDWLCEHGSPSPQAIADQLAGLSRKRWHRLLEGAVMVDEDGSVYALPVHPDDPGFARYPYLFSEAHVRFSGEVVNKVDDAEVALAKRYLKSLQNPPFQLGSKEIQKRRRAHLHKFRREKDLPDMDALSRYVGLSSDAIYGIVRGDRSRYSEETKAEFLKKIECPADEW